MGDRPLKIKTAKLEKGRTIHTSRVLIWSAAYWVLNNKSLAQALQDGAWLASGLNSADPMLKMERTAIGHPDFVFETKIYEMVWIEVTK